MLCITVGRKSGVRVRERVRGNACKEENHVRGVEWWEEGGEEGDVRARENKNGDTRTRRERNANHYGRI